MTQLSLEDNKIKNINNIIHLKNLMELYLGNNRLSDLKEIHHLKQLPKLIILDLSGNTLCKIENSRMYIVYLLRKLKVLDGVSIETNEQTLAKDM